LFTQGTFPRPDQSNKQRTTALDSHFPRIRSRFSLVVLARPENNLANLALSFHS
jgi:hypothetical protein